MKRKKAYNISRFIELDNDVYDKLINARLHVYERKNRGTYDVRVVYDNNLKEATTLLKFIFPNVGKVRRKKGTKELSYARANFNILHECFPPDSPKAEDGRRRWQQLSKEPRPPRKRDVVESTRDRLLAKKDVTKVLARYGLSREQELNVSFRRYQYE